MDLQIPLICSNGEKLTANISTSEYQVINSIDDFISIINKEYYKPTKIEGYEKIKENIQNHINDNKKSIEYVNDDYANIKKHYKSIRNDIITDNIEDWDNKFELFRKEYLKSVLHNHQWIRENKNIVFEWLDTAKQNKIKLLKENQKIADAKYYQKQKELLGIETKVKLTKEQKKENKRKANAKYQEKQKELLGFKQKIKLTAEQKRENKRLSNAKYYEKLKEEKN